MSHKYNFYGLVLIFLLSACSYSQKTENVRDFIDYGSLATLNKMGSQEIILLKEGSFSGKANIVGIHCSAHSYSYNFNQDFESSVREILDKVYETPDLKFAETSDENINVDAIHIIMKPVKVNVMCYPASEYNWRCASTTTLSGELKKNDGVLKEIVVEQREITKAGGLCGGGSNAVTKSVGVAINNFNLKLYDALVDS